MAYFKGNAGLEEVARRAALTQETAAALKETDRLRGHLYTAVGAVSRRGSYAEDRRHGKGRVQSAWDASKNL